MFAYGSDNGVSAYFKDHLNIINLMLHKNNFSMQALGTFSAAGHGKGPCNGIGATVKSSAS